MTTTTATCIYCGQTFTPPALTTPFCEHCYYSGRHHEAERAALLAQLTATPQVERAEVEHTGGGCFGLAVTLADRRYLFATAVDDARLPDVGQPWSLRVFESAEAVYESDGVGLEAAPRQPLTDAELLDAVRAIAAQDPLVTLAQILSRHGCKDVTVEYPGCVCVWAEDLVSHPDDRWWFGTANETWGGDLMTGDGSEVLQTRDTGVLSHETHVATIAQGILRALKGGQ